MILYSLILASQLHEFPNCRDRFRAMERNLDMWSRARRAIDDNGEEHKYHRVTPEGVTIKIVISEVPEGKTRRLAIEGFEPKGNCVRDGVVKTLMIKVTERK